VRYLSIIVIGLCLLTVNPANAQGYTNHILYLPDGVTTDEAGCENRLTCAIAIITADGDPLQTFTVDLLTDPSSTDVSADGRYFLNGSVFVDLRDGTITQLHTEDDGHAAWANFAPDGDQLAYTYQQLDENGNINTIIGYRLHITDINQTDTLIVDDLNVYGEPTWSLDDAHIFIAGTEGDDVEDTWHLYQIDVETGDYEAIYTFDRLALPSAELSPDGTAIAYHYTDDPSTTASLRLLTLETGETTELTQQTTIGGFDWSPDGTQITYIGGDGDDSDVCIIDVTAISERCLGVDAH